MEDFRKICFSELLWLGQEGKKKEGPNLTNTRKQTAGSTVAGCLKNLLATELSSS